MFLRTVAAILATYTFAIIFNAPRKELILCGLVGGAGWLFYELLTVLGLKSDIIEVFLATVLITALSRILSIRRKIPLTVYLISGIIPFVPGAGIYYTMYYIILNDAQAAIMNGINTLKISGAISLGIMSVLSLPFRLFSLKFLKKK